MAVPLRRRKGLFVRRMMIELLRIYSNGFLENVTIEDLAPWALSFFLLFLLSW
jgi:hypothetical protein